MQAIGDRIKQNYERPAKRMLVRRQPVIVRIDGKAFHTFTRDLNKPFDQDLVMAMACAATATANNMQGFKAAYVQSDEASFLLTDYDAFETEAWFGYCQNKIESVTASLFTGWFNFFFSTTAKTKPPATFDARAFNVPREEVSNYFLWRMKDWERNSLSMFCRAFFSDKEMHGKCRADQHEMLHKIGKNWTTDLPAVLRNGTWIVRSGDDQVVREDVIPDYEAINKLLKPLVECDRDQKD